MRARQSEYGSFVVCAVSMLCGNSIASEADECRLSASKQVAAATAFRKLVPIFQEPRCLNCHGAVNPFSESGGHGGGYIDIRNESAEFLRQPDLTDHLTIGQDPDGTRGAQAIAQLRRIAANPTAISDNDFIRNQAFDPMRASYKECHLDSWLIPMSHNYFVGRSALEMCVHMKTSDLTNTRARFLHHMQDDELILEAFKGKRGLLAASDARPPAMSFDTMAKMANDWIAAMDGEFHSPADCGCKFDGVILSVRHRLQDDVGSTVGKMGQALFDGEVIFNVGLKPIAPDWLRADISVPRSFSVSHITGKCRGVANEIDEWNFSARLSEDGRSMSLQFGYATDDESGEWQCDGDGPRPLSIWVNSRLEQTSMAIDEGTVVELGYTHARGTRETMTITVVSKDGLPN